MIEEVSKIIEKVIIIKSGMIIEDTTTEQLLSSGYSVSGPAAYVDEYISGKNVIGIDNFAGLKIAYILGTADKSAASEKIEFMQMDLQKLFVKLTNS